jgi:redox-sensitive bicupin YhaK (pirin superfamily)
MPSEPVLEVRPLGFPWQTDDPFLFCVHHDDRYPAGNERLGPKAALDGRNLGQDFEGKDGWRMYHGRVVPGFPQHPHRGFETVTIVRRGYIDHSDSLGATARFGQGDVQWLTAGGGIVHSEMFPLLRSDEPNPLELFQIWLNLPSSDKLVAPYFSMFWHEQIPRRSSADAEGRKTEVTVIAGGFADARPLAPPPNSWAARSSASVAIWTLKLEPGARFTLPAAPAGVNRTLYFFRGQSLLLGGRLLHSHAAVRVRSEAELALENGPLEAEVLILQGRPIAEPVAQYGPFVMNSRAEIQQAISDYQRTQFGGWPWPDDDPVHEREAGRFARHADGRVERVGEGRSTV